MDNLSARVQQAQQQIVAVKNPQARRDLIKMLKTLDSALSNLSKESVECRRLHKPTARYQALELEAEELINNLEQFLIFACLLGG